MTATQDTDYQLLQRARLAASQVINDIEEVKFIGTDPSGVRQYEIFRKGGGSVKVFLNPNGKAAIEWKHGSEGKPGYRVFSLQGLVPEDIPASP